MKAMAGGLEFRLQLVGTPVSRSNGLESPREFTDSACNIIVPPVKAQPMLTPVVPWSLPTRWPRALAVLAVCLLGGSLHAAGRSLDAFFSRYLEESFRARPLEATRLGDHRFDDQLDDLSAGARGRWVEQARRALSELPQQVAFGTLSRDEQVDYEMLRHELEKSLWLAENTHPYEEDPRVYSEYVNDSVYLLLTQSTQPRSTNLANAVARMASIPNVVAAARANLHQPPRVHTETAIRQNQGALGFYEKELFLLAGKAPRLAELQSAARRVVACLREYQRFLEEDLLPRSTGDWRLGRERFARKLEFELDAGMTMEQVRADAESEYRRVLQEMYVVARQLWSSYFPRTALPPEDPEGRRQTIAEVIRAVAKEHGRPECLTRDVRRTVAEIRRFIAARDLLRLPDPDRCTVIEMPEFQRGNSTAYMNSPPPLDPAAAGYFAVSPPPRDWDANRVKSYLEEYNRHMVQILTIHEAYPGHYVQYEYANRHPSLVRRVLGSGVYVEGWAVYAEQTMLDEGYGGGNLALRLNQLKFYLRAVANAILDQRMHAEGLGDAEALEYLTREAFQSEGEARLKIIRAKQSSCQLSTYFVGRMAHYRLRQEMQRELGDRFQLGRYHEAVLGQGPVSVRYLPELVRGALARTAD